MNDEKDYLDAIRRECERIPPSQSSPVYMGLKRMVEDATVGGARGYVLAKTDLQETTIPAISKALNEPLGSPLKGLPPRIENQHVDVFICGVAQTRGIVGGKTLTRPRGPESSERLVKVWKSLFTHPELVVIVGYCEGAVWSDS
jgi:hypothetical protein